MSLSRLSSGKTMKFIMVGNPGVGKSSTLNAYVKKLLFFASPSFDGRGVTDKLSTKEVDGVIFLDTPGLDDVAGRKKAAEQIELAMQEPGEYRLFFAVVTEVGRIRPCDCTTIKLVMDAINAEKIQCAEDKFSILFPKTKQKWLKKMEEKASMPGFLELLNTTLSSCGVPKTKSIHFGEYDEELEEAEDTLGEMSPGTRAFLDHAPKITVECMNAIDYSSYEDKEKDCAEATRMLKLERELKEKAELEAEDSERKRHLADADKVAAILARNKAREERIAEQRKKDYAIIQRSQAIKEREQAQLDNVQLKKDQDKANLDHANRTKEKDEAIEAQKEQVKQLKKECEEKIKLEEANKEELRVAQYKLVCEQKGNLKRHDCGWPKNSSRQIGFGEDWEKASKWMCEKPERRVVIGTSYFGGNDGNDGFEFPYDTVVEWNNLTGFRWVNYRTQASDPGGCMCGTSFSGLNEFVGGAVRKIFG